MYGMYFEIVYFFTQNYLFSFDFAQCILVLDDSTLVDRIVCFVHSLLLHCQCGTTVKNYVYLDVLHIDFPGNISCFSFCYHIYRITKNFKTTISWHQSFGSLSVLRSFLLEQKRKKSEVSAFIGFIFDRSLPQKKSIGLEMVVTLKKRLIEYRKHPSFFQDMYFTLYVSIQVLCKHYSKLNRGNFVVTAS